MLSTRIVELLIFAVVAFFLINRLISLLGTTSEDDPTRSENAYGEKEIKDVTDTVNPQSNFSQNKPDINEDIDRYILGNNKESVRSAIYKIIESLPDFKIEKFLKGSKAAFQMTIEAFLANNIQDLQKLVDKRFMEKAMDIFNNYGPIQNIDSLEANILDITIFGNSAIIKVNFTGKDISAKIQNLKEDWTFQKSLLNRGPEWYITNIDLAT